MIPSVPVIGCSAWALSPSQTNANDAPAVSSAISTALGIEMRENAGVPGELNKTKVNLLILCPKRSFSTRFLIKIVYVVEGKVFL